MYLCRKLNKYMNTIKLNLTRTIITLLVIFSLTSCRNGSDKVDNYFKVDEDVYELTSGSIINNGAVSEGFIVDLRLYSADKTNFINFELTTEQAESLPSTTFTDFKGSWITGYNSNGSYSNTANIDSGKLTIDRNSNGYTISFNGTDQYGNSVEVIFKGELSKIDEDNLVHNIPDYVIPEEIFDDVNEYFPVYFGINPPEIEGEYVSSPHVYIYNSEIDNPDTLIHNADRYMCFRYSNNQLNFYGKQDEEEEVGYGVKISGDNNYFTCYYVVDGYVNGYYAQQSFLFSGKKTSEGIEGFHTAVILLETSGNPNLPEKYTFRVLKDEDGLAENNDWLSKSGINTYKLSDINSFNIWKK